LPRESLAAAKSSLELIRDTEVWAWDFKDIRKKGAVEVTRNPGRANTRKILECMGLISQAPPVVRAVEDFDEVALNGNFWGANFLKRWARPGSNR